MLNFKKAGIFSRGSGQEDACEQEDQSGGVLAVWGSPGSGKTTVAVRLAKYLADKRRNVILLLCDMTAPMLPCICPAADLECERSLGSVLAAAHVSENLVKNNLVTHKRLGYPKGCNNRHPLAYCRGQTGERVCGIRPGSGLSHRRRCTQRQRKSTKSAEAVSRPG